MEVDKIKEYLVEELPEFSFMTGEEANQPEENHNSLTPSLVYHKGE